MQGNPNSASRIVILTNQIQRSNFTSRYFHFNSILNTSNSTLNNFTIISTSTWLLCKIVNRKIRCLNADTQYLFKYNSETASSIQQSLDFLLRFTNQIYSTQKHFILYLITIKFLIDAQISYRYDS